MYLKQKDDRKLIRTKKKVTLLYSKQTAIVSTKDSVFKTPSNNSVVEYVDEM